MISILKTKRFFSMLLIAVMTFTAAVPAFAQAAEQTESISEEDYSVSPLAGDITPPVILDVELLNNGNVAANDRYVYIQIEGYDSDGGSFSAQESTVIYHVPNCMRPDQGHGSPAESVTDNGNGKYTFKFPVDHTWYGPYVITELIIGDDSANTVKVKTMDESTGNFYYKGTIARPVSAITASNVTINNSVNDFKATLTDNVLNIPYSFEADVVLPANVTISGDMTIVYRNQDNVKLEFNASYDGSTGKIFSNPDLGYFADEGTYTLDSIIYDDEFLNVAGTAPSIIVEKQNTDKTAPVVTDVWFEANGVRNNNFTVRKGTGSTDQVEVFVTVSDSSAIDMVEVNLQTAHPSYENPWTLQLQKVQGTANTYSVQVPLDDYGATVWYVDDCYAYDIYQNMEPERHITPFFTLRDEDNDTTIPTMKFNGVEVYTGHNGQWITYDESIVIDGITSLDEILTKIGRNLGTVDIPSGVNFEGWYIGNTDSVIPGTTPAAAAGTDFVLKEMGGEWLIIAPKYDKLVLNVGVNYNAADSNGGIQWREDRSLLILNHGSTVQDALNQIDLTQIQHHPDFVLDKYECDGYDSTSFELNPCNTTVWYSAVYSSFPVWGSYHYYNQDGERAFGEFKLPASPADTHQDVLNKVLAELNKLNLNHYPDYGQFLGWEAVPNWYSDKLNEEAAPGCYYEYSAVYDKRPVEVTASYLDVNGDVCYMPLGNVSASNSTTYQDLVTHFAADLSGVTHPAKYGFSGWTVECSSMSDVIYHDYVEIKAQYNSYPVTIVYTYQGTNGLTNDMIQLDVAAGTDMGTLFDQRVNPTHDSSLTHTGWKFFSHGATANEPSLSNLDYHAAAVYTGQEPVWVITAYVDKNNEHVQGPMVCYTPDTVTHQSSNSDIDNWIRDVKSAALTLISVQSKYSFSDLEVIGYDINDYSVFTKYSTAPVAMLLPQTAKTEVIFVYPDGTSQMQVMDANSSYTLPAQINGDNVFWIFDHPFGLEELQGGASINLPPTFFTLTAEVVSGSGGTTPPAPPVTPVPTPTPPVIPTPVPIPAPAGPVELDPPAETQVITNIQQAAAGTVVKVNMTTSSGKIATVVTKEMLQAAQGKNVSIELDMGDYSWTIHGDDIKALHDIHDVNLEVILDTNAIPSKTVQNLAGGKPARQLSLTYNGDFGFKADLTINVGKQHANTMSSLYYYDSMGKLVFIDSGTIDANGNTSLSFSHASDYVVVVGLSEEEVKDAEIEAQKAAVKAIKFKLNSKLITTKTGKKAVKLIWDTGSELEFNGVAIYRSTKKNSGYGKKPFFTSTKDSYINTAVKKGNKYYYKVRGFVYIDGEKVYTDYSTKAWRTVK